MKTTILLVRTLLGLIFLVFGLNGFLHFLSMPAPPAPAQAFFAALATTGYMVPLIMGTQVVAAALLLTGFLVPLALIILAPVIVNIVAFHLFLAPDGMPLAIVVTVLELTLAWQYSDAFRSLFGSRSLHSEVRIRATTMAVREL